MTAVLVVYSLLKMMIKSVPAVVVFEVMARCYDTEVEAG